MTKIKHSLLCGVTAFAAVGVVAVASMTAAQAGGFALREQSAIGQGASFAGVAAGGGHLSAMYWNPATLTQTSGTNTESVFTGVVPNTDLSNVTSTNSPSTADPGSVGLAGFIPSSYSGMQVTEDLFLGLSVNAPFGLATKANNPSASSFHSATAKIFTTDVKANVAYRINDAFSVGAAVGLAYAKIRMTSTPVNHLSPNAGNALEGDAWAPTWAIGATVKPFEGTTIGIGYRSGMNLDLKGDERWTAHPTAGNQFRSIQADLELPGMVTVGVRQDVTDKFRVMGTFEWTDWSTVHDPIPIRNNLTGTPLELGYEDNWFASIGAEYSYNEDLTVRAGLGYEKSPIPIEHRHLRLPDADRVWASIGASYNVTDEIGVDVGYSHLFVRDVYVHGSSGSGPTFQSYSAEASSSVDIISASLRYNWKAEPMFEGDEPIVRKY